MVLVSLLVDQLSGLFLIFFGRPKKNLSSIRSFLFTLLNFLSRLFWKCGFGQSLGWPIVRSISPFFGRPTKKVSSLRMDNFFGWPQKNEKLTRRLVGQRDWSKPHGRLYHVLIPEVRPSNLSWCHNLNTKCCNLLHFFIIFVIVSRVRSCEDCLS